MQIVTLSPRIDADSAERRKYALEVLEKLMSQVLDGTIVAFCGVSIEADDATCAWAFSPAKVSRLRMMGALASLEHAFHEGHVTD